MPADVDDCVDSVLEENPDYEKGRAYAICKAQQEAAVEEPLEVVHLAETDIPAEGLDQLAADRPNEWGRFESEYGVAWVGLSTGATVYQGVDGETETEQDGFTVDVLEVRQNGDDGPGGEGDLLGMGVDFPEADVYVDWNIEAWPDDEQLSDAHVSIYSTVEDLRNATGNRVEAVDTIGAVEAQALFADFNPPGLEQQAVTIDAVELGFPPGGEVIDHEEGDWEAFLDDLATLGDPFQVWKGIQRHPEDDLESHDHATYLALDADRDVTDVEDVLEDHPAVEYTINAGSVGEFDQPDGWDLEGSDFYHGTDSVEQQAAEDVTFQHLAEFMASHLDGADVTDVTGLLDQFDFTGLDERELATLVAQVVDVSAGEVLEQFDEWQGNAAAQEGETVTFRGLSQEGLKFVRERFSVDVIGD